MKPRRMIVTPADSVRLPKTKEETAQAIWEIFDHCRKQEDLAKTFFATTMVLIAHAHSGIAARHRSRDLSHLKLLDLNRECSRTLLESAQRRLEELLKEKGL